MPRYQFIVAMTLAGLEAELNLAVDATPSMRLNQVFYAQGTGFVGVLERAREDEPSTYDRPAQKPAPPPPPKKRR